MQHPMQQSGSARQLQPVLPQNQNHHRGEGGPDPWHANTQETVIRWQKGDILGQGAFGTVFLGLNLDNGELMAVKQLDAHEVSAREMSALENEIQLMQVLLVVIYCC
jgi:serine/threonine protein kinase